MADSSEPWALIISRMARPPDGPIGAEELQAVHAGHAHIGQDDIRIHLRRTRQRAPSLSLGGHLVTGLGEQESQRLPETRIVVNDQNAHQPPLPVAGTP